MNRLAPEIIDFYDGEVSRLISEKYGYSLMDSLRQFVFSKTHEMLENADMGMTAFGAGEVR